MSSLFYQKGVYQPIVINFNRIDGSSPTVIDVKCKVETYTLDATYFTVLSNGDMTNRAGTNVWVRPWRPRPSLKSGVYFITYTYTIDGTDSTFVETVTLGAFGGGGSMGNYPNDYLRFDDKRLDVLDNLLTKDYFDERIVGLNKLSLLVNKLDELSLKFDSFNLDNINFDVLKDDFSIFFNDLLILICLSAGE